jgi:hypothetical protein|tara:strand:- start:546 stop:1139 length:594 start_codon:yes stop_codon:yes gene_type:complete
MGTNYYDSILFQTAEEDLGLSLIEANEPQLFVTPTTTYSQYKTAVGLAYDSSTPLEKKLIDYHMSALTEVVSSGVTTDPDYWSASSINGTYIINSGLTASRVGIGTIIPTQALTVSGAMSASSHVYVGDDLYVDMIRRASSNSTTVKLKTNTNNWEAYAGSSSLWSVKINSQELLVGQGGTGTISAETYQNLDGGTF